MADVKRVSKRLVTFPGVSKLQRGLTKPTGATSRVLELMKASSAESSSASVRSFSLMSKPAGGAISNRISRVIPGRHPEDNGGVCSLPARTRKKFAELHSA